MAGRYTIHTNTSFRFYRISTTLFFLLFFAAIDTHGQQRCGTAVYMEALSRKNVIQESDQQFEDWLKENLRSENRRKTTVREMALTYKVQVVVHVIHNGENVGLGLNISDAQIMSQLLVLNEDKVYGNVLLTTAWLKAGTSCHPYVINGPCCS